MKNKTFIEHLRDVVVAPSKEQLLSIESVLGWKKLATKKKLSCLDSPENTEDLDNALNFSNPNDKGLALINVIKLIEKKIKDKKEELEIFCGEDEKSLKHKKKTLHQIKNDSIEKYNALLYLNEAVSKGFFKKPEVVSNVFKKKNKKKNEKVINFEEEEAKSLIKQLEFNVSDEIHPSLIYQLKSKIPLYPIAKSLDGFQMLDWQIELLGHLSSNRNVIVCTPTSSGKTFIVVAYLINALKRFYNKKLYYCAPNDTLAMEIATMFNKIQDLESKVSYLLDNDKSRLRDERIIVFTPQGAINEGILDDLKEGIFCMDEVHAISHNPLQEIVLQKFAESSCQNIILSATLANESIDKLVNILNADVIKANTRFMVHQRWLITDNGLKPFSPLGAINKKCLNEKFDDLDLVLTPLDAVLFYERVLKEIGQDNIDVSICPEVYFGLGKKYTDKWDDFFEKNIEGLIKRYTLKEVQNWVYEILNFLKNQDCDLIFEKFKMDATSENVLNYDLNNVFKLILELKNNDLLPALFFHSNEADCINFSIKLYQELNKIEVNEKEMEKRIKAHENRKKEVEKLLKNAEKAPLSHGEKRDDRKYRLMKIREELDNLNHSFDHQVHPQRSLVGDNQIPFEEFKVYSSLMQEWDKNLKNSHILVQMIMNGIGLLIPSMNPELQAFIRQQYANGTIKLLMTEKCMAYGINTPTRTSIISPELDIIDQIQAAGRAGRKGYENQGNIVFFRQEKIEMTNCLLPKLKSRTVKLVSSNLIPEINNEWITNFEIVDEMETNLFSERALLFGKASVLVNEYVEMMMDILDGESNKPLKFILGFINILPNEMKIDSDKEWNYNFNKHLIEFFNKHQIHQKPNRLIHDYLMNMLSDVSYETKKELINCSQHWQNLLSLLINYYNDYPKIVILLKDSLKLISKSKINCLI